ncbi:protein patched [Agrilus planipennis]|uniref:Protein patched n=1 Tax=Agrilus planipennis TaxID=224129 RepID=A0A1W4W9C1_AGRPL|nr:protein patched [Agrilus planipennis]
MASADSQADPERHRSDLYVRPGWVDAAVALIQIEQGKARGDRGILWIRVRLQRQLRSLGTFLEAHAGKVIFVSLLVIATFCVGLKSATFHSDILQLWAEPSQPEETPSVEVLSTHQIVVQTVVDPEGRLLHSRGLLEHLNMIRQATQVTVTMFDITWKLKDICQSPSVPDFDVHYIEQMFENMMPCTIITPLDCFWEGSKLLGPEYPVHIPYGIGKNVKWTNLNPSRLVAQIKEKESRFDYHSLEDYFRRAGITSGYQEKPCLDPFDPDCPLMSPNRNSSHPLDVGAELTSGCYGFAAKYMHWPEDLIVGGVVKNKTGHIKQAQALQTVVQLMGEHELYEFWSDTYKVHHIGWNQEKASMVLNAWQKRFSLEVERLTKVNSSSYNFNTFSTSSLNRVLAEESKTDFLKLVIALTAVVIYGWLCQSFLAALGILLLSSSAAASLGVCSLLGLPMNLLSTHVLPFVTVGLAMREIFLLLSTQKRNVSPSEVLQRSGPTILVTAISNAAAFIAAAIVPIPALRVFCMQCAVIVLFHGAILLLVFPAFLALKVRCKKSDMPCLRSESKNSSAPINNNNNEDLESGVNLISPESLCKKKNNLVPSVVIYYSKNFLLKPFFKVTLCLTYAILIIFCVFNGLKLEYDVRLSTFLPRHTQEYKYLEAHNRFFGFYNFYLVTTELEYPLNQPLLYEYHASLTKVPHVMKDSNGGLNMNDFWLANFRDFLLDLQQEFDVNRKNKCLNSEKWFPNATEKAVLAFKLLAQTGVVEFPVDKSQILNKRLVEGDVIDPKAFYNYLSVWNSNDQMSYSSSQANLTPKPFQYYSTKTEYDLKIPKSQPLIYTQMPFYFKNLRTTGKIIDTLKQVKEISASFVAKGLKNYPIGLIFSFFNQLLVLDKLLLMQLAFMLGEITIFTCFLVHWSKLWCLLFCILTSMLMMCLMNINALTGTLGTLYFVIISRNVVLVLSGFLNAVGNRERRVRLSLEVNAEPIFKGDIGLLTCVAILSLSNLEFIRYHIFMTLVMSVCSSLGFSLLLFPVVLSLVGPKAEVQPLENSERISTPPPPPPPQAPTRSPIYVKPTRRNSPSKTTREPSLTTITEESCNQSIVVEPQVTVEYSSPESSSSGPYTTKVTATANIKVEVVTPIYRSKCSGCRTKCGRHKPQCHCCKQDSDNSDSSSSSNDSEPSCRTTS